MYVSHTYHRHGRDCLVQGQLRASWTCFALTRFFPTSIHRMSRNSTAGVERGLRQQWSGQWKPTAANGNARGSLPSSSLPAESVKPSSPPVTCPFVTYCCTFPNAQGVPETLPYTTSFCFPFTSIKYITVATRPALTRTPRRLGALDTDSAVTTAYTNYHHGRHHRPRRHVPAHGH